MDASGFHVDETRSPSIRIRLPVTGGRACRSVSVPEFSRENTPPKMKPLLLASLGLFASPSLAHALGGGKVFVPGARINSDHTVTLPLHEGRVGSRTVWFIVTDASD